jgi:hypothetical protein
LGFSTGHFGLDPLAAEAARKIAWEAIDNLLVAGDRLSVYAYELEIWDEKDKTVPENHGPQKDELQDLFPLTHRAGSEGGHDTELALVDITNRLGNASDAVIVLLANTAASIAIPDRKPIGTNDPRYKAILRSWNRLPAVNESGASLQLPYVTRDAAGEAVNRSLDVVILVPQRFVGEGMDAPIRSERLSIAPSPPIATKPNQPPNWSLFVLFFVLVLGLTYATVKRGSGSKQRVGPKGADVTLQIGEADTPLDQRQKFELSSVLSNHEICHLAGPHYPQANHGTVTVGIDHGAPPWRLARVFRHTRGVRILNDAFKVREVDGAIPQGDVLIPGEGTHRITVGGTYEPDATQPPRNLLLVIEASFLSADRAKSGVEDGGRDTERT